MWQPVPVAANIPHHWVRSSDLAPLSSRMSAPGMIDAWLMVTRARFWMRGSGGLDGRSARSRCALRVVARRVVDGFMADLVAAGGRVAVAGYGSGPDELTVVLVAEQRYLVAGRAQ